MSAVFFKDVTKRHSDLLTKDFGVDEYKLKVVHRPQKPVTLETTFSSKKDGSSFVFAPKYEYAARNATFSGEINSARNIKGEVSVKDLFPGSKLTITNLNKSGKNITSAGLEYKKDAIALTANVENDNDITAKASINVNARDNIFVGASASYNSANGPADAAVTVAYNTNDFDIALRGSSKFKGNARTNTEVGINYFSRFNSSTIFGAEVTLDPTSEKIAPRLAFGGQTQFDATSNLKAKVDTEGYLNLAYLQKFGAGSFTAAWKFDTTNNKNTAFGVSYTLE